MWNQNSSCSEIHTVFFFRKGTLKVEICKWHGFSSCKIKIVLEAPQRSDLAIRERESTNFWIWRNQTELTKHSLVWTFVFREKNFSGTMGFCFQWTKCCGFFFLSVDKMLWAFFSTQNELLVVAQHYPHATNRPTRAQRVFSCSARVANRMRRHTDRTVRRRTAEKWKHKKILPFVT